MKKILLNSEAFPPDKRNSLFINDSIDNVHKFLKDKNIEDLKSNFYFETIKLNEIDQIFNIFQEWFPMDYSRDYIQNLIVSSNNNKSIFLGLKINKNTVNFNDKGTLILGAISISKKSQTSFFTETGDKKFKKNNCLYNLFFPKYFGYINILGVVDELRQLGYATLLLNKAISNSIFNNTEAIYLHVVDYNYSALRFYYKNNFTECSIGKDYNIYGRKYKGKCMILHLK